MMWSTIGCGIVIVSAVILSVGLARSDELLLSFLDFFWGLSEAELPFSSSAASISSGLAESEI